MRRIVRSILDATNWFAYKNYCKNVYRYRDYSCFLPMIKFLIMHWAFGLTM